MKVIAFALALLLAATKAQDSDHVSTRGIQVIAEGRDCDLSHSDPRAPPPAPAPAPAPRGTRRNRPKAGKRNGKDGDKPRRLDQFDGRYGPDPDDGDRRRCARTLVPPGNISEYLPDITYTMWKCGLGSLDGCVCGIARVVVVPADAPYAVAMDEGEYLSEDACNANCMRGEVMIGDQPDSVIPGDHPRRLDQFDGRYAPYNPDDGTDSIGDQFDGIPVPMCYICVASTTENGWTHHYCRHKADLAPLMNAAVGMTRLGCAMSCNRPPKLPWEYVEKL